MSRRWPAGELVLRALQRSPGWTRDTVTIRLLERTSPMPDTLTTQREREYVLAPHVRPVPMSVCGVERCPLSGEVTHDVQMFPDEVWRLCLRHALWIRYGDSIDQWEPFPPPRLEAAPPPLPPADLHVSVGSGGVRVAPDPPPDPPADVGIPETGFAGVVGAWARVRAWVAGLIAVGALLVATSSAGARPTAHFVQAHTTVRVSKTTIAGHRVRIVSWRPGDRLVRAIVGYSRSPRTVPGWAQAGRRRSRAVAAMNGGTWHWTTLRPVGTVWSRGRRISRTTSRPAVGFLPRGRVVFGARSARRRGSVNIVAGTATLIRHGRVLHRFPWASPGQIQCGARGTDGPIGCYRSNVVRFKNGRVGLVEVAFASMATAASILHSLHVQAAVTMDSGGSANLWTLRGDGGCSQRRAAGRCFGITQALGLNWERRVPDGIVVSVKKAG